VKKYAETKFHNNLELS